MRYGLPRPTRHLVLRVDHSLREPIAIPLAQKIAPAPWDAVVEHSIGGVHQSEAGSLQPPAQVLILGRRCKLLIEAANRTKRVEANTQRTSVAPLERWASCQSGCLSDTTDLRSPTWVQLAKFHSCGNKRCLRQRAAHARQVVRCRHVVLIEEHHATELGLRSPTIPGR